MRDARKPVIPLAVEQDEDHVLLLRNGDVRAAHNITFAPDDVGRMQAGYVCVQCYETQDEPFPKACWVCQFPMADRQMEVFAKSFKGNVRVGPSTSMEDELGAIQELEDRQKREASISVPQIIVPRTWQ